MIAFLSDFSQRALFLFLVLHALSGFSSVEKNVIPWSTSYEEACLLAEKKKMCLLVFFKGSDWCKWSQKLSKEIVEDPGFINEIKNSFVFVEIDYPSKVQQNQDTILRYESLKTKYNVDVPSLVLLNSDQNVISKLSYLPINPQEYALYLKKIVDDFHLIEKSLQRNSSQYELEKLYEKAKMLGCNYLQDQIFAKGLEEDMGSYFLLEKYCTLLERNQIDESVSKEIRKEIEIRDPKNQRGSLYRLALLDFQFLAQQKQQNPQTVIEPLLNYVKDFGEEDSEHVWRIEMMISQYLFTKNAFKQSLEHARASYKAAPEIVRKEIADSIQYIRSEMRVEKHQTVHSESS